MTARARFQAPHEPGAVLADPPLSDVGTWLHANERLFQQATTLILGSPLQELRCQARLEALKAAEDYLRAADEPLPTFAAGARPAYLFISGHQPELVHPGVWVKHFALNGLARVHGGMALNLVVDTDLAKSVDVKVPSWESARSLLETPPEEVHRQSVPFDRWTREAPFEERTVLDEELFSSLPERLAPLIRGWPFSPLLPQLWKDVLQARQRTKLLGERFAAARRAFERRWGCHNYEVPVSLVCGMEAFAWFACHVLSESPRFHALYNATVQDYRRRNGIKNERHPVPDLAAEGDWLEVPFWGWQSQQDQRNRLMVRLERTSINLRLGNELLSPLPPPGADPHRTVMAWMDLARRGVKLRSRALTTTMFARMFLGDLFVHGIGGAKYDEITDAIIRGFYGMEPPRYLVLSATLYLPFPTYPAQAEQARRLDHEIRDLWWNPQRHLNEADGDGRALARLAVDKHNWIERSPANSRGRRERYQQLRELTERMRPHLASVLHDRQIRRQADTERLRANAILQRRDYAFCLFPEERLRAFYSRFLTGAW